MARRGCLAWVVGASVSGALALSGLLWWWSHPRISLADWQTGAPTSWAARQRQEERWREERLDRAVAYQYVPLERISLDLQLAVLVGEDIDFFGHGPIDFRAVQEVLQEWRQGGRLRGASTVSRGGWSTAWVSAACSSSTSTWSSSARQSTAQKPHHGAILAVRPWLSMAMERPRWPRPSQRPGATIQPPLPSAGPLDAR